MTKTILLLLSLLVFSFGCSCNKVVRISPEGFSSDNGIEKLSRKNQAEVKKRMKAIKAELAKLKDHPWAGVYAHGMHPGAYMEIAVAPKAGFAYTYKSTDLFYGGGPALFNQNYGKATWEDGRLKLSPSLADDDRTDGQDYDPFSTEFVLIPWGDQLCLIPADRIINFCNAVNSGFVICFFRDFHYGTRRPTEKPDVPEEFKPYLLEKPIEGQVISVGETKEYRERSWTTKETVVKVDKGSQDGILPGMEFYVTSPEKIFAPIKLTQVSETESEGIIKQDNVKQETPQIDWTVSTSLHRK